MKLKVIGSGSSGNCYVLTDSENNKLVLEAGVSYQRFCKGIDYELRSVMGVFITHEHMDHAQIASTLQAFDMDMYMSKGTANGLSLSESKYNILKHEGQVEIGPYSILPFNVVHNANEPLGFMIYHEEMGVMVFITDSSIVPERFPNCNHWLIESNYIQDALEDRLRRCEINIHAYNKAHTHLSLENCTNALLDSGMKTVRTVTLCHLSENNADWQRMIQHVARKTGIMPGIAVEGYEIELT
jgi:phosphoribosyl 1,2-cyclic phosphodiesterase